MSAETDRLAQLEALFEGMSDDERCRALNYLRAKFVPNGNLPEATGETQRPWIEPTDAADNQPLTEKRIRELLDESAKKAREQRQPGRPGITERRVFCASHVKYC